jgi:PAS domain S-box-containing protein
MIEVQRKQLSTVFNSVTDAIVVIDDRGIIETVNDAACRMFRRPSYELVHHSVNKLMPESIAMHHDRYVRNAGRGGRSEKLSHPRTLSAIDGRGRQFPISTTLSEIPAGAEGRRRFVATIRDLTDERAREDRIRFLAFHDEATKLPNRHGVTSYLFSYFESETPEPVVLVHLSLNHSAEMMACFGIEEFDELVLAFSQRLKRVFGTAHLIARGFGNTFHLVLPLQDRVFLEANLRTVVSEPVEIQDLAVAIDISAGMITLPEQAANPREAMHRVGAALLEIRRQAPSSRRPRLHVYQPSILESIDRRTRLVHKMRHAIDEQEFTVHLQPKVDITDRRWIGAEALARWTQPNGSMISPGEFIPLAEQSGLVASLNRFVLRQTLRALAESDWDRAAPLSVNISAQDLNDTSFTAEVAALLTETRLPASALVVEITERDIVSGHATAKATIDALRELGVAIAMDDFGVGYSSLATLSSLPVDIIKIDRQFLRRIEDHESDRKLLGTLYAMSRDLGHEVIIEGVETEGQAAILRDLGARWAQGFLFARPAPAIAVLHDDRRPVATTG